MQESTKSKHKEINKLFVAVRIMMPKVVFLQNVCVYGMKRERAIAADGSYLVLSSACSSDLDRFGERRSCSWIV
jgi:hypothetical protein